MLLRPLRVACALSVITAGAASAQTTFAYRYDQPVKFQYVTADTIESTMDTPMGAMTSTVGLTARYTLNLSPHTDSTHVKVEVDELSGSMQAMGQSMPIPDDEIGPFELMMSRRGEARTIQQGAGGALGQIPGLNLMSARMFVRLPPEPVAIGATWSDTVAETVDSAGMRVQINGKTVGTYVGDTTVSGRRMHVLRVVTDLAITGGGNAGGMDMTQDMKSVGTATWLWDPQRSIFAQMTGEMTTTGVMNVATMGAMNMNARMRSRAHLAEQ